MRVYIIVVDGVVQDEACDNKEIATAISNKKYGVGNYTIKAVTLHLM